MKKILVVDDNHDLLRLIELRLAQDGYSVSLADNGHTGLEMARKEQPDAIILDIMMPEMDGWEFCKQVRAFSGAPILMLTAKSQDEDIVKGLELGADEYLVKPVRLATLSARIEALLRRKSWAESAVAGEVDALKSSIVAALSQELRTPVALILNALEMVIHEAFENDPEGRAIFLKDAQQNADTLRWLIEDLLLLVRIENGLEILPRPASVHALLHQIVNRAEPHLNARSIHAQILFPADPLVQADQILLRHALHHLFSNSLHHSPDGATITIIGETGRSGALEIDFHDQGAGIDTIYQEQIFERFYQIPDHQSWKRNGLGIGLFIAREIARAHGGNVTVHSKPGEGATFRLTLPAAAMST